MLKSERKAKANERPATEWNLLIDEWVHDEIDRKILKRTLLDGASYLQVSEEIDLTIESVKKRIRKAESQLFRHI